MRNFLLFPLILILSNMAAASEIAASISTDYQFFNISVKDSAAETDLAIIRGAGLLWDILPKSDSTIRGFQAPDMKIECNKTGVIGEASETLADCTIQLSADKIEFDPAYSDYEYSVEGIDAKPITDTLLAGDPFNRTIYLEDPQGDAAGSITIRKASWTEEESFSISIGKSYVQTYSSQKESSFHH